MPLLSRWLLPICCVLIPVSIRAAPDGSKEKAILDQDAFGPAIFIPENERETALLAEPDFLEELRWGKRIVGIRAILAGAKAVVVNQLLWQAWSNKAPKKLVTLLRSKLSA